VTDAYLHRLTEHASTDNALELQSSL